MKSPRATLPVLLLLSISSLIPIPSHASAIPPHQEPLGPSPPAAAVPFTFRDASIEDIDDIATVLVDAFLPAPLWRYIHQFADDVHPLYTWTCQRDALLARFRNRGPSFEYKVITVQEPTGEKERAVSIAVWEFDQTTTTTTTGGRQDVDDDDGAGEPSPYPSPLLGMHGGGGGGGGGSSSSSTSYSPSSAFDCPAHLDTNMTRARHYSRALNESRREYLEPAGRQVFLQLLATHPDWDGNGFAAHHLRWGKAQLGRDGGGDSRGVAGGKLPLTLISTPVGYPVYVSEGFEGLKNVTVERLDGKGVFWHEAMKFEDGGSVGADEL